MFSTFFFETQFLRWISNETHVESKVLTELVDLIGEELLKQGPQTVRGRLMFNEGIHCTDLLKHDIYETYLCIILLLWNVFMNDSLYMIMGERYLWMIFMNDWCMVPIVNHVFVKQLLTNYYVVTPKCIGQWLCSWVASYWFTMW